jgi:glycosyltransferase involved in cell wall biosynthesis/tetratricopeptide (TPR) repeat protein
MHPQTGSALAASARDCVGFADLVVGTVITGWALDMSALGRPTVLRAVIDGLPAGEVRCGLPREDVRAAGIACDRCGFRYAIPADFLDGRHHVLRLEFLSGETVGFPDREGGLASHHRFRAAAADALLDCADMQELLRAHGIRSDAFLSRFDPADYVMLNAGAALSSAAQCVGHFARVGRPALCPIALPWRFDPAFYGDLVAEAARLDPAEAYLHWLNTGLGRGIAPNRGQFLKELGFRRHDSMPNGFDPAMYRAFNADLPALTSNWLALRHAVHEGVAAGRRGCPDAAVAPELYLAAADRLAVSGRLDAARDLYGRVLAAHPEHPAALQHLGDCLLRRGDPYAAEQAYLRVVAAGGATIWTSLNLAKCLSQTGRFEEAVRGLAALHASMPGDVGVEATLRRAEAEAFDWHCTEARGLAAAGFLAQGRARMAQAAAVLVAGVRSRTAAAPLPVAVVRYVAIVADMALAQCRAYRVAQKVEQLEAAGCTVQVYDQTESLDGFAENLRFADAAIFYRVAATPPVAAAIEAARAAGLPTFYEIDDLIFDPVHYPDSFESYGGLVSAEIYASLVTGTELFRAAMSLCDTAVASTAALAAQMGPHVRSGRAFVHRNALGLAHLRAASLPRTQRGEGPVRLFYGTGTRAGNEDFCALVAPALDQLMQTHGDGVELVVMGHLALPACLAPHAPRIRMLEPVWDLPAYWRVLGGMDVNIAVLKDGLLSDCKSEIKWLEAAMLGIPSVVSPTGTYRETVRDGETGLLASDPLEWFTALDRLVRDPAARQAIGDAARKGALKTHGPGAAAGRLRTILRAVETAPKLPRPHRVLIVNVFYSPQEIGGATRVVADNVRDLRALHGDALEIEVFTTTEGGAVPYGMRCYVHDGVRVTAVTAGAPVRPDWVADDPRMGAAFGRVLDRFHPDLVHFHCIQRLTGACCAATRARDIPYLVTVHDGWWLSDSQFLLDDVCRLSLYDPRDPVAQLERGGVESFRRMAALGVHLAHARAVLAVSDAFADLLRGCGVERVVNVANGVSGIATLPRTESADGRVRLAHIGGAAAHKGYQLLRAALWSRPYRNLSLLVLDHALLPGGEVSDIWGTVPVRFEPRCPQQDVGALYARIDVLAAPSLWPESFGLVAREAVQAGCWVIASDRGAMGADLTPETGFVVDVSSPASLAAVLARIDEDPARYRTPPPAVPIQRTCLDQAVELGRLYLDVPRRAPERPAGRRSRGTDRGARAAA